MRWLAPTLRNYAPRHLLADISAGLVVTVLLIPQAMAYALLAGLPPVVGLYASTFPLLSYALLGSSRQLAVGPVAIDSLLTLVAVSSVAQLGSDAYVLVAALLAVLIGLVQVLLGLLRVGFVVNFLSPTVIAGFTSAAALVIASSQLEPLLGLDIPARALLPRLGYTLTHLGQAHTLTVMIALASILLLMLLKPLPKYVPSALLLVVLTTWLSQLGQWHSYGVAVVGDVPSGLPRWQLPRLTLSTEAWRQLFSSALTIALIGFIEAIAIAKSFATRHGYRIDANQELLALGVSNLSAGLMQGYPVNASFSRSAMQDQTGARSQLSTLVTFGLTALSLLTLGRWLYHLPLATLAALIIMSVTSLLNLAEYRRLQRISLHDGWIWLLTFGMTLLVGVQQGIITGLLSSLALYIWRSARPHAAVLGYLPGAQHFVDVAQHPNAITQPHIVIVRPDASLYFANVRFLQDWLETVTTSATRLLLLDCSAVNDIDGEVVHQLGRWLADDSQLKAQLYLCALKGPVRDVLQCAVWYEAQQGRLESPSLVHLLKKLGHSHLYGIIK